MRTELRTDCTLLEAVVVATICFGLPIWSSTLVVAGGWSGPVRGFTNGDLWSIIGFELACAPLALWWLQARRFDIATLYPAPTWAGGVLGGLLYLAASLAGSRLTAAFAAGGGFDPGTNMVAHAGTTLPVVIALALVNGAYEEVFLLGVLVRGLRGAGMSFAIGCSLLVRVLYHTYQGPVGTLWIGVFGLVLSLAYWRTGSLFPAVFAHVLADIVPFL